MKRTEVIILFITIALLASLTFAFSAKRQLSLSQQSATLAQQQVQIKKGQVAQLSKKVSLLSKKLKAAENRQILSYKLKNGDTLYELFGSSWQKIAKMNKIKSVENLPAGKLISFEGYVHRVKKGENFCKLFGNDWQRIAWLNGFCAQQAENLPAGQCLKVPKIT